MWYAEFKKATECRPLCISESLAPSESQSIRPSHEKRAQQGGFVVSFNYIVMLTSICEMSESSARNQMTFFVPSIDYHSISAPPSRESVQNHNIGSAGT